MKASLPSMFPAVVLAVILPIISGASWAQQDPWDVSSEIELGATLTTGNTDDENARFSTQVNADREQWRHEVSLEGFRSSQNNELAAQRVYFVGESEYAVSQDRFIEGRASHEDDRFSGFDSQSEVAFSYGHDAVVDRDDMEWQYTLGLGVRISRAPLPEDDFNEGILRMATDYTWDVSDNAEFFQTLSVNAGERNTITRAETGIETDINDYLSMQFTVDIRNQSSVPADRANLDTETALTLLLNL